MVKRRREGLIFIGTLSRWRIRGLPTETTLPPLSTYSTMNLTFILGLSTIGRRNQSLRTIILLTPNLLSEIWRLQCRFCKFTKTTGSLVIGLSFTVDYIQEEDSTVKDHGTVGFEWILENRNARSQLDLDFETDGDTVVGSKSFSQFCYKIYLDVTLVTNIIRTVTCRTKPQEEQGQSNK